MGRDTGFELFDGKLAGLAMTADCFVNPSIGPRTNESDHLVPVDDTNFALVAGVWTDSSITWVCLSGQ
jgi:hypothetical protein